MILLSFCFGNYSHPSFFQFFLLFLSIFHIHCFLLFFSPCVFPFKIPLFLAIIFCWQSLEYVDYILCWGVRNLLEKNGLLGMTLNCIWWWGSRSWDLRTVGYWLEGPFDMLMHLQKSDIGNKNNRICTCCLNKQDTGVPGGNVAKYCVGGMLKGSVITCVA